MYGWIWRKLPGAVGVKAVIAAVLILGVAALLLFVIFPWVDAHLPISQVTVGGSDG
jgi:hypothetical protein